jgi:fatty-acyl-CoA synthase
MRSVRSVELRKGDSLSRFLEMRAGATPDAPALYWNDAAISYAGLLEESRRVAAGLAELGIGKGDRIALWLPNCPAWLALHFACARLGAIAVAVNTRFRHVEVADIVGRSGARLLVLWPDFRGIDFRGILEAIDGAALDRVERMILYGGADAPAAIHGTPTLAYRRLAERPPMHEDHGGGPVGSNIFTTSGTTKAPKFVLHDHFSVVSHARNVLRRFRYDAPGSVLLQALPLCGVFGFAQAMAGIAAGAPLALQASFDAEAAAEIIERRRVTSFNGTDEMFARLLAATLGERPFPSLRFCGFAAFNPTLAHLVVEAEARGLCLAGLYGASEVQALFALQDTAAPAAARARPGGYPVAAGYGVRVRDPETGRLLRAGESGELELTGPSVMAGYFGDAAATARAFTPDGWVRSGDLGHLAGDGSFVFETRMGDVLRLAGFLVAPSEIEAHLQTHAAIDGAQVVDAVSADKPVAVAYVTLRQGALFDEAALRQHCAVGLAAFKVPARIVALDAFPTTASANGTKVQRVKLRELAAALLREA